MIEERTIEKDNILLDQLEYDVIILGTSLTETILSAYVHQLFIPFKKKLHQMK